MSVAGWLKLIGGGVAAPFTGGATLPVAMSGLADVLGGAAKSGAQNNQAQDTQRIAAENAKLNRDKFATAAPGTRMTDSIRAAIAKTAAPSSVSWNGPGSGLRGEIPQFSGGLTGAIQGVRGTPQTQDLMSQVLQDELMQQKQGGISGGNQDANMGVANPSKVGKTSTFDKILGGGALGTSILAALLGANKGITQGASSPDDPGMS